MGLFLTIALFLPVLISGIFAIIERNLELFFKLCFILCFMGVFLGGAIGVIFCISDTFENLPVTNSDKIIPISKDGAGYRTIPRGGDGAPGYTVVIPICNGFQSWTAKNIDEVIILGDDFYIREITKSRPRTFWKFGALSTKTILYLPESVMK